MKVLLSPSKSMNTDSWQESPLAERFEWTHPLYEQKAGKVMDALKKYSSKDIQKLMKVSEAIANTTVDRNNAYKKKVSMKSGKPALALYTGDVYQGVQQEEYSKAEWKRAQERIRIISGLYGIVRPGDLIQPYRLEMKTKLSVAKASDLYAFWHDTLGPGLLDELKANEPLVNLASQEYARAVKGLEDRMTTITFKEKKGGALKVIGLLSKRARGLMANYIVRENVKTLDGLKEFSENSYRFQSTLSSDKELVFVNASS